MMILPLRAANAAALGALVFALHEIYIFGSSVPVPRSLLTGYSICVVSAWMALVAGAYFHERAMRRSFTDYDQAAAKVTELKERMMAMAVQRHQSSAPDRALQNIP
jgi:hypothetical protein